MKPVETEVNFSFETYVLMSLGRIHAVSCDPTRSYTGYGQESGIDQLWNTIPTKKKKDAFKKAWATVLEEKKKLHELKKETEREAKHIELVGRKQQIVTDLLNDLNLLFAAPNSVIENWLKAKEKAQN